MLMMRGRAGGQGAHHRGFVSLCKRASAASAAPERVLGFPRARARARAGAPLFVCLFVCLLVCVKL